MEKQHFMEAFVQNKDKRCNVNCEEEESETFVFPECFSPNSHTEDHELAFLTAKLSLSSTSDENSSNFFTANTEPVGCLVTSHSPASFLEENEFYNGSLPCSPSHSIGQCSSDYDEESHSQYSSIQSTDLGNCSTKCFFKSVEEKIKYVQDQDVGQCQIKNSEQLKSCWGSNEFRYFDDNVVVQTTSDSDSDDFVLPSSQSHCQSSQQIHCSSHIQNSSIYPLLYSTQNKATVGKQTASTNTEKYRYNYSKTNEKADYFNSNYNIETTNCKNFVSNHGKGSLPEEEIKHSKCYFFETSDLEIVKSRDPSIVKLVKKTKCTTPTIFCCTKGNHCINKNSTDTLAQGNPMNSQSLSYSSEYVSQNYNDLKSKPCKTHQNSHHKYSLRDVNTQCSPDTEHSCLDRYDLDLSSTSSSSRANSQGISMKHGQVSFTRRTLGNKYPSVKARYPLRFHSKNGKSCHNMGKQHKLPSSFCPPSKYGREARKQYCTWRQKKCIKWPTPPTYSPKIKLMETSDSQTQHCVEVVDSCVQAGVKTIDTSVQHRPRTHDKHIGTRNIVSLDQGCQANPPEKKNKMVETTHRIVCPMYQPYYKYVSVSPYY